MTSPEFPNHYQIANLTREFAVQHSAELTRLANEIPIVKYTEEDILAESKGSRIFHNKWDHSLVVVEGGKIVGFMMAYEREAESNEQYPNDTLYMSELAIDPEYRRRKIARRLIETFLDKSNARGFLSLSGDFNYSLQTNSADWNSHVLGFYESFGFEIRATKKYPDAVDYVLGFTPQ